MTTEIFSNQTFDKIREAIVRFDNRIVPDIYVISFLKYDNDDDPRRPGLTVGYNTYTQCQACSPKSGQQATSLIASNLQEAKWNYAFWLQNEELIIGRHEYDPVSDWVKELPYYYSDKEEVDDIDRTLVLGEKIKKSFMNIIVSHAKRLHDENIIRAKFGKDIPIVIHELEYYDTPLYWTKQGNPEGLVREFEDWILGFTV